jgi:hypothetical protein
MNGLGTMFGTYLWMFVAAAAPIATAIAVWRIANAMKEVADSVTRLAQAVRMSSGDRGGQ